MHHYGVSTGAVLRTPGTTREARQWIRHMRWERTYEYQAGDTIWSEPVTDEEYAVLDRGTKTPVGGMHP